MDAFHADIYASFLMRVGSASHLYLGAIRRGLSERTDVGAGLANDTGSEGQTAEADGLKVGEPYAAELVVLG